MVLYLLLIIRELIDYKPYTDNELQNLNWEEKCRLIQIDFTVRHELKEEASAMVLGFQSHDITVSQILLTPDASLTKLRLIGWG